VRGIERERERERGGDRQRNSEREREREKIERDIGRKKDTYRERKR
jgi:hypothetical protein